VHFKVINLELLNACHNNAKHVLSFVMLRKYQDPSDPSRSLNISPVPLPMSSSVQLALFAKVMHWQNRETTRPMNCSNYM